MTTLPTVDVRAGRSRARRLHDVLLRTDSVAILECGKGEPDWPIAMVADAAVDLVHVLLDPSGRVA